MYDKNNILYCETPKCHSDCPVGVSAKCVSGNLINVNDMDLNTCECLPGWNGTDCSQKIFINFR